MGENGNKYGATPKKHIEVEDGQNALLSRGKLRNQSKMFGPPTSISHPTDDGSQSFKSPIYQV